MLREFLCLIAFLTRLPSRCDSIEDAARGYFLVPLVGALEGFIVAFATMLSSSPLLAGSLGVFSHIFITGGLHLDGFADYFDAIGAGARGETAVKVMKDPRRGSFAIAGVSALIVSKYSGLAVLHDHVIPIVASYVLASEAMYIASSLSPRPKHLGLGRLFYELGVTPKSKIANILLVSAILAIMVAASPLTVTMGLLAGLTAFLLALRDTRRRLGYASGDALGFIYEVVNTSALIASGIALYPNGLR